MADLAQSAISVKVRSNVGGFKFRVATVTSDGSGTTIPASLLDMNYIDHAILSGAKEAYSAIADYNYLAVSGNSTIITLANAMSDTAEMDLQAWGW